MGNAILWLQSTTKTHTDGQPQDERWQSNNGAANVGVKSKDNEPEQWADGNIITGTAVALYTTGSLIKYGFPYSSVIFTKSAAVQNATLAWQECQGVYVFTVTGITTETLKLTATNQNGNTIGAVAVKSAANIASDGSALAAGTYYLLRNL